MTFIDNYNHKTWIYFLIYIWLWLKGYFAKKKKKIEKKNRGEEDLLNDFISYYNKNWIMLASDFIFHITPKWCCWIKIGHCWGRLELWYMKHQFHDTFGLRLSLHHIYLQVHFLPKQTFGTSLNEQFFGKNPNLN